MSLLKKRGFFSVWEFDGEKNQGSLESPLILPPLEAENSLAHSVHLTNLPSKTAVRVPCKVKSILLSDSEDIVLHIERGVVASVEILRCAKVVVHLRGLASYLRADDSRELHFSLCTLPEDGIRLISSCCHSMRASWEGGGYYVIPDSSLDTRLLPGLGSTTSLFAPGTGMGGWGVSGGSVSAAELPRAVDSKLYDVCIVGGGISGLAVAANLPENLSCVLVEA